MPSQEANDVITRLLTLQSIDTARIATDRFKLPTPLREDVDADLAELLASEMDTAPKEGARAGATATRRAALVELERQLRGGYMGIAALDEETITEAQRLQVFESYGWQSAVIGTFTDGRVVAMARLAATVTAAEVGGTAAWMYSPARLTRIAAQLAIIDMLENPASGADRQAATLRRDSALRLASDTLLRARFYYCSASRDVDQTPELARIGFQPRRDPGEAQGGETPGGGGGGGAVPGAMENVTVDTGGPGTGQVIVDANPRPASENVTEVRVYSAEGQVVGSGASFPLVVGGFTPGTVVVLTVRAVNAAGEGPDSASASGTTG